MANTRSPRQAKLSRKWLWMMLAFLAIGIMGATNETKIAGPGQTEGQKNDNERVGDRPFNQFTHHDLIRSRSRQSLIGFNVSRS